MNKRRLGGLPQLQLNLWDIAGAAQSSSRYTQGGWFNSVPEPGPGGIGRGVQRVGG